MLAAILDEVERAGVFLVALDSGRRWFRYHRLFGELLRHELDLTEPTLVPELHRRAAVWSAEAGAVTDAVEHYVAADQPDAAAPTWSPSTGTTGSTAAGSAP